MNGRVFAAIPLILLLVACEKRVAVDLSAVPHGAIQQGVELMPTYCLTCHGVGDLKMDEVLAPPLWGVRAHYLSEFREPQAFVDAVTEFLLDPHFDRSRMPIELERYGVKAPVSLSEEEIRAAAWAIYAGEVERPPWSREYQKLHRDCDANW